MNDDARGSAAGEGAPARWRSCGPEAMALPTRRDGPFDPPPGLLAAGRAAALRRLVYPDGHLGWLVTGHALGRALLADPRFSARSEHKRVPVPRPGADVFLGRPALPGWFVDMDPPEHARYRRLLAGRFTARRVDTLRPWIGRVADEHLDAMARAGPPADLVAGFALPVPSLVICEILGVPRSERAEVQRNSATLFSLEVSAQESAEAMRALTGRLGELVRLKRRRPGDDLLSELVASDLSDEEITGTGVFLFTAGHETVSSMLSLGSLALLHHPEQRDALIRGQGAPENAAEELLRYLTIFQFGVPRTPVVDVEVEGRVVRAGENVTISLPVANRDPEAYDRPDELDLGRPVRKHLAFGHGVHLCLGQHLARAELQIGYAALFRRFPGLRSAVPLEEVPLAVDSGFYGVHRLPVTW
nr:cytochrome P450 [Nocardiopsis halophila]